MADRRPTEPRSAGADPEPRTEAGKALVEWASRAAPNQIDLWREHAVLIEDEAQGTDHRDCDAYECRCPEGPRESTTDVGRCGRCGGDVPEQTAPLDALASAMNEEVDHAWLIPEDASWINYASRVEQALWIDGWEVVKRREP